MVSTTYKTTIPGKIVQPSSDKFKKLKKQGQFSAPAFSICDLSEIFLLL